MKIQVNSKIADLKVNFPNYQKLCE